jgi:TPR repeat protein
MILTRILHLSRDAEAGNAFAQGNLGLCYFYGSGIAVDKAEAVKWYNSAAEVGHAVARISLRYAELIALASLST